jgi:hypothetical protein
LGSSNYKQINKNLLFSPSESYRHGSTYLQGFKKCCLSSPLDETDDDMLWNGSVEFGNVRGECGEDEGTGCEDGDSDTDW